MSRQKKKRTGSRVYEELTQLFDDLMSASKLTREDRTRARKVKARKRRVQEDLGDRSAWRDYTAAIREQEIRERAREDRWLQLRIRYLILLRKAEESE